MYMINRVSAVYRILGAVTVLDLQAFHVERRMLYVTLMNRVRPNFKSNTYETNREFERFWLTRLRTHICQNKALFYVH